jgi:hypothetical protein
MNNYESLKHTRWECKYQEVFRSLHSWFPSPE